jgi:hypothetical protein
VYRNIMAFFVCKGCCFAGIPVQQESEGAVSVRDEQVDLDLDMDMKVEDDDAEGGVSLSCCYNDGYVFEDDNDMV